MAFFSPQGFKSDCKVSAGQPLCLEGPGVARLPGKAQDTSTMRWRHVLEKTVFWLFRTAALINGLALVVVISFLIYNGWRAVNWTFLTEVPRDSMTKGGIMPCIVGTLVLSFGAMGFAFPWGVASAIYLHEYAKPGPVLRIIRLGIGGTVTREVAEHALKALEVDEHGLDEMDKRILLCIIEKHGGGPVGLNTIAVAVGEEPGTVEEVYEPYLIQEGFLQRTPRGREATSAAYRHFRLAPPDSRTPGLFS